MILVTPTALVSRSRCLVERPESSQLLIALIITSENSFANHVEYLTISVAWENPSHSENS